MGWYDLTSRHQEVHCKIISRRSQYVKVEFNEKAFNQVATLINPNVNPSTLDILTGVTRVGTDGKPETYYDKTINDNVDVRNHCEHHNQNSKNSHRGGIFFL